MAGAEQWTRNLDNTNLFFHHIGKMKFETGSFKVVKQVDLKLLESQINRVKIDTINFENLCLDSKCINAYENTTSPLQVQVQKLQQDLNSIYALMGSYRRNKRALNFVGTGLKWMFGTMDNDDSDYIQEVLQNLGNRLDTLHSVVDDTVHLMKNLSKQWELLVEIRNSIR